MRFSSMKAEFYCMAFPILESDSTHQLSRASFSLSPDNTGSLLLGGLLDEELGSLCHLVGDLLGLNG